MRGPINLRDTVRGWRSIAGALAFVAILLQAVLAGAATPRAALDPYAALLGVICTGDHDGAAPTDPADQNHGDHGTDCCLAGCLGGACPAPALGPVAALRIETPRLRPLDRLVAVDDAPRPETTRRGFEARGPPTV